MLIVAQAISKLQRVYPHLFYSPLIFGYHPLLSFSCEARLGVRRARRQLSGGRLEGLHRTRLPGSRPTGRPRYGSNRNRSSNSCVVPRSVCDVFHLCSVGICDVFA